MKNQNEKDPKIRHVISDDLRNTDFRKTFKSDWKELKERLLNDEKREKLKDMNFIKKIFVLSWWLLKQMFFKLAPIRRILFVVAIVLLANNNNNGNSVAAGVILIVFLLMLELKDKITAKDELEAGRQVQNELLPDSHPDIEGWDIWLYTRSANEVGGDLIDYLGLSENKYSVSLGDVSGKGLSAALLMAKLQATIRALAEKHNSLSELCKNINLVFHRDSSKKIFASLIHLELEENGNNISLVNAGHLPPLHITSSGIKELNKGGPALGLTSLAQYNIEEIDMKSGDILFIYSDGLTEARNENGEFYGKDRTLKLVETLKNSEASYFGERFVKNVDVFRGDEPAFDDLSMVVIKKL